MHHPRQFLFHGLHFENIRRRGFGSDDKVHADDWICITWICAHTNSSTHIYTMHGHVYTHLPEMHGKYFPVDVCMYSVWGHALGYNYPKYSNCTEALAQSEGDPTFKWVRSRRHLLLCVVVTISVGLGTPRPTYIQTTISQMEPIKQLNQWRQCN